MANELSVFIHASRKKRLHVRGLPPHLHRDIRSAQRDESVQRALILRGGPGEVKPVSGIPEANTTSTDQPPLIVLLLCRMEIHQRLCLAPKKMGWISGGDLDLDFFRRAV